MNKKVEEGDTFKVGKLGVTCISTPCHTSGHMSYLIESDAKSPPALFSGDCLFIVGCGRFFEGTAQEMHVALNEKFFNLPDSTSVFCGHEYTLKNLAFGLHV